MVTRQLPDATPAKLWTIAAFYLAVGAVVAFGAVAQQHNESRTQAAPFEPNYGTVNYDKLTISDVHICTKIGQNALAARAELPAARRPPLKGFAEAVKRRCEATFGQTEDRTHV